MKLKFLGPLLFLLVILAGCATDNYGPGYDYGPSYTQGPYDGGPVYGGPDYDYYRRGHYQTCNRPPGYYGNNPQPGYDYRGKSQSKLGNKNQGPPSGNSNQGRPSNRSQNSSFPRPSMPQEPVSVGPMNPRSM